MSEQIKAFIEKVIYRNEENGFHILSVEIKGKIGAHVATVNHTNLREGMTLELEGAWIENKKFGLQFKSTKCHEIAPETAEGLKAYLSSDFFFGVGPVLAARIVKHFGADKVLEIFKNNIGRLIEVKGVSKKKLTAIKKAWLENQEINEVMMFLQHHGISSLLAVKIHKHYGSDCINKINHNPYVLSEDIEGISFVYADKIALSLGMEKTSEKRIGAAVKHVIQSSENSDGHCFLRLNQLIIKMNELLDIDVTEYLERVLNNLEVNQTIKASSVSISDNKRYYLNRTYFNEEYCVDKIKNLLESKTPLDENEMTKWLQSEQQRENSQLSDEQSNAVVGVLQNSISVLTGSAGCGKTHTTKTIIKALAYLGKDILLAAPTGRAAKRASELTGMNASTIHRLLKWNPMTSSFEFNEKNPLECNFLIIDEASMIDIHLASSLMRAIPPNCQVVFVGDFNQLPPVGPGSFFKDMIESNTVPVFRLTKIFRQGKGSDIILYAHEINNGQEPDIKSPLLEPALWSGQTDCLFIDSGSFEENTPIDGYPKWSSLKYGLDAMGMVKKLYTETIPKYLGANTEIQILSPMNVNSMGTVEINKTIQQAVNPAATGKLELKIKDKIFRIGDRVMQKVNNYDLLTFNGEIGEIIMIDPARLECVIKFGVEEKIVEYKRENLLELDLAYCVSIHKSQGSEFDAIIIMLMPQHSVMLARQILYTAITRGKRLVVFVSTRGALSKAIKNITPSIRQTSLKDRLMNNDESLLLLDKI